MIFRVWNGNVENCLFLILRGTIFLIFNRDLSCCDTPIWGSYCALSDSEFSLQNFKYSTTWLINNYEMSRIHIIICFFHYFSCYSIKKVCDKRILWVIFQRWFHKKIVKQTEFNLHFFLNFSPFRIVTLRRFLYNLLLSRAMFFLFDAIHIAPRNYRNIRQLYPFFLYHLLLVFTVHHIQSVQLEQYYQSIFACEEDVHVWDYLEMCYQEKSEN